MTGGGERLQGNSGLQEDINLFDVVLSPEEADSYFREVKGVLTRAKEKPYGNVVGRLKGRLAEGHHTELVRSFGILMPLSLQECVQRGETGEATPRSVAELTQEVMLFLSSFKNTGVRSISPDKIIPTMVAMLEGRELPR